MRRRRRGFIGTIIVVLLLCLVIGGVGVLSKGFKDWNVGKWFDSKESAFVEDVESLLVSSGDGSYTGALDTNIVGVKVNIAVKTDGLTYSDVHVYVPEGYFFIDVMSKSSGSVQPTFVHDDHVDFKLSPNPTFLSQLETVLMVKIVTVPKFVIKYIDFKQIEIVFDDYVESFNMSINFSEGYYTSVEDVKANSPNICSLGYVRGPIIKKTLYFTLNNVINLKYTYSLYFDLVFSFGIYSSNIFYGGKESVPLPQAPVREGHTFLGWYLDEALTNSAEGKYITDSMKLYPKFEIHRYTVILDIDGIKNNMTVDWSDSLSVQAPVKTGYTFIGWYSVDDIKYEGEGIKQDITLYAKFDINVYKITFLLENDIYMTFDVEYGFSLSELLQDERLAGYNVKSVQGDFIDDLQSATVSNDVNIELAAKSTNDKFTSNWQKIAIAGGGIILLGGIVALCIPRKKKRKGV